MFGLLCFVLNGSCVAIELLVKCFKNFISQDGQNTQYAFTFSCLLFFLFWNMCRRTCATCTIGQYKYWVPLYGLFCAISVFQYLINGMVRDMFFPYWRHTGSLPALLTTHRTCKLNCSHLFRCYGNLEHIVSERDTMYIHDLVRLYGEAGDIPTRRSVDLILLSALESTRAS